MDRIQLRIPIGYVEMITEDDGYTQIWLRDQRIDLTCCNIWIDGDARQIAIES